MPERTASRGRHAPTPPGGGAMPAALPTAGHTRFTHASEAPMPTSSPLARRALGTLALVLLVLLVLPLAAHAQTIFSEAFDGSWTTPTTLLTGGQPWAFTTSNGDTNNVWHRNDYTTGWALGTSGAYSPTGALSTANSARFHTYEATSGSLGALITPTIDFSAFAGSTKLSIYHINTSGTDTLRVY